MIGVVAFILSYFISPYATDGDQHHYRMLYNGLDGLSIGEGFKFYSVSINSVEPIYFFLSWVSSNFGLSKDIFSSILNVFFAISVFSVLRKLGAHYFVIIILLFFNYYSWVLYFSADRLKLSFIFLFFSLSANAMHLRLTLASLSILSHIQNFIIYLCSMLYMYKNSIFRLLTTGRLSKKNLKISILLIILGFFLLYFSKNQIQAKFGYFDVHSLTEILRALIFMSLSLLCAKRKSEVYFLYFPLLLAIFLLGGSRLNVFAFIIFVYFSVQKRKGVNLAFSIASIYFLYTAYLFARNIVLFGNGFETI